MDNTSIILGATSGVFAVTGLIFKLVSLNTNKKLEFVRNATPLNEDQIKDTNNTIKPIFLSTILQSDNPVILKYSNAEWIYVKNYIYNQHRTKRISKQDYKFASKTVTTVDTSEFDDLEHRKTKIYQALINKVCGIDICNLLPIIVNEYGTEIKVQKPKENREDKTFLEKVYDSIPQNVSVTETSCTIDMKPEYVGDVHKRHGILKDNSQYLIIGNFNGKEILTDDNLIIKRNKNINDVVTSLEFKKAVNNTAGNVSLVASAGFLVGCIIKSKL